MMIGTSTTSLQFHRRFHSLFLSLGIFSCHLRPTLILLLLLLLLVLCFCLQFQQPRVHYKSVREGVMLQLNSTAYTYTCTLIALSWLEFNSDWAFSASSFSMR